MATPPTGTVTFLFTDIEGSTRRWEAQPEAMKDALARHDTVLREGIERHGGHVFKTVGDAAHAAFATAPDALRAAVDGQRVLAEHEWGGAVRMALHTGVADERDGDYFGPTLNRVARLRDAGHGGQILLSEATQALLRGHIPNGVEIRNLGEHRLRDLAEPEHVYQAAVWGLPADFPPLRTEQGRASNLPAPLTSFVGRERELDEVARLLETARLVTLTGSGGTGKTRLAVAVGERVREQYPDGVWFVDLSPVAEAGPVASAIAQAVGVREGAGRSLADSLKVYLRDKRRLLVLDNFEQVVDAAPLVRELLAACPGLVVLVTSRAPLHLSVEREYPVPPLPVPTVEAGAGAALVGVPSVALFVQRAQDVKPDFALTAENAAAIADICARLDGLPLAIELAASRIRVLLPQALRDRLDHRLAVLTGGAHDLPRRQQTLRDTIAWSYDLLDEVGRALFRRLAVFAGGWTLDAAEAVGTADGDPSPDVLDGLESLAEKSLLRLDESRDGEPRFTMLAIIREFGLEQLRASGDEDGTRRAHAAFFLRLVEAAEPHLRGADQVLWLDRLQREHDNFRAALGWVLEEGEVDLALRLSGALTLFWWARGFWREGATWLDHALAPGGGDPIARALALAGAGFLHSLLGEHPLALRLAEEAVALRRQTGDARAASVALHRYGIVLYRAGELERGAAVLADVLALLRERGDEHAIATALGNLGRVVLLRGDYADGTALLEEALPIQRRVGDDHAIGLTLTYLAQAALVQGDQGRAGARLREALLYTTQVRPQLVVENLSVAAVLAHGRGEMAGAVRLFAAAEAWGEQLGGWYAPNRELVLRKTTRLQDARDALDQDAYAAAYAEGRALSLDAAIALALEQATGAGDET